MGDSDDEYDRKRRDKFRGERSSGDNYRSDRRGGEDRSRGREDWPERGRGRPDYRDYRGPRERFSPERGGGPPVKRMRTDWGDDGRPRYGHEPYGPYGGAWGAHDHYPMHGGHAFAPHPSSLHARLGAGAGAAVAAANANNSLDPANGDLQTQPPMLTLKQFLATQDDSISDSDAISKYNEYKQDFRRQQLNEFFVTHKDEEWFKIKYHPEESLKRKDEQMEFLKKRASVFNELLDIGLVTEVNVDTTQTEKLLRLLDTVVIKLEGGTDEDLKVLDEKPVEVKPMESIKTVPAPVQIANTAAIAVPVKAVIETDENWDDDDDDKSGRKPTNPFARNSGTWTNDESAVPRNKNNPFARKVGDDDNNVDDSKEPTISNTPLVTIALKSSDDNEDNWDDDDEENKQESETVKIASPTVDEASNDSARKRKRTASDSSSSSSSSSGSENDDEKAVAKKDIEEDDDDEETGSKQENKDKDDEPSLQGNEAIKEDESDGSKLVSDNLNNDGEKLDASAPATEGNGDNANENVIDKPTEKVEPQEEEDKMETIDLDKEGDPKEEGLRALHKTSSIFLRNLAPTITKSEVENMCKRYSGFLRVAIADPLVERRWFRRGWVTFQRDVNIKEICWNLNNIRLRDCELGAIVNRDLSRRVRPINGITAHKTIVRSDIKLCAKIAHNLDIKANLWTSDESGKTENGTASFGLNSNNPVLQNITDYLIEEASAEEDELLGLSTGENKDAEGELLEREPQLILVLDKLILYLRVVHSVDFYNHCEYPYEDEMPNRCGIIHARGPAPQNKVTNNEIQEYIRNFEGKMSSFLAKSQPIEETELKKLGCKDIDAEVEKFVQANTQELAKDKWLCPLSGKKFKGPDFIRKHIFNKHGEKVDEVKKEVEFFNNYLQDPKRPQLPEHPGNSRKAPVEMQSQAGYRPGYPGPGYGAPYAGYAPPMVVPPRPRGGGFGGRRGPGGGGGDYRPIIHYRDLDAPREPDDFL